MSEPSAAPSIPALAKYELLEEIGHGGMATVYRALDPRLGREVAIKVIHKHLRENSEVSARFAAEARAAAKLRHPGIVEVYDVSSEQDGERFLVVELIRGTTLRRILQQHRDMPAEIGASIVLVLCEALEHAHVAGIVHRDVKPENVLVELPKDRIAQRRTPAPEGGDRDDETLAPRSRPRPVADAGEGNEVEGGHASRRGARKGDLGVLIKLTDFGIAKILDAQGVTSTGQVLGSPAHMAPEQIEAGEVDGRTDVFALGVLMYECLVGHLPFEGKNPAQVLRRVLEGAYAPVDRERAKVGGRWARIVAGALVHDPGARTRSPGLLGEQIRAELEALGITDPHAEIATYFDDPNGYTEALEARLVPRLVARGERARKVGDVTGAAADFNRAQALAPHDLAILKRVTSLTTSAARKQMLRWGAAIVAGSVVLGFVAFGVARWRKTAPTVAAMERNDGVLAVPTAEATIEPVRAAVADIPSANPTSAPAPLPEAPSPSARIHIPAVPSVVVSERPPSALRKVVFSINPKGATLLLDGKEVGWFGATFSLNPGSHAVEVEVPGSKCCKPLSTSVLVTAPPDQAPDEVQRVPFALETLPASVSLVGAPPNAQISCPGINFSAFAGSSKQVTLPEAQWSGRCQFLPPSPDDPPRKASVTLRAGESNVIPWPAN